VEREGKALAADEADTHHHRPQGVASVHVRAAITWLAIFPLAAAGMSVLAGLAPEWPPVLRAFVLTLVVVPTAVYVAVPRLLLLHGHLGRSLRRRGASRWGTRRRHRGKSG
jgi:antibiotic biosynthesis monooxygenase (ABM) superfamily enzyme